ncbi:MAG: 2-dehydropantoate 2-reductase [Verrucomicrobiales bacterium]
MKAAAEQSQLERKHFAIVGAGALGSYYGARLAQAGERVSFLLRSDYEVVAREGLRIESVAGDFTLPSVEAARQTEEIGPVDIVLVCWKATANAHYEETIRPLVGPQTLIVTLQNGLGNVEELQRLFGADRVLGGLCFVCLNRLEAGLISHTAGGRIALGEPGGGTSARLENLVARLKRARIPALSVENLGEAQWRKLVWNVPFNGLTITEGGIGTAELLGRPGGEQRARELMAEVIAGAAALGFVIEKDFIEAQIALTRDMGDYRPSSMIDYVEGRAVEIEAIWGEPLKRAQAAGAELPAWTRLLTEIKAAEEAR